jgi:hypothetical protein
MLVLNFNMNYMLDANQKEKRSSDIYKCLYYLIGGVSSEIFITLMGIHNVLSFL